MYHRGHDQQRKMSRQASRQLSQSAIPPMSPLEQVVDQQQQQQQQQSQQSSSSPSSPTSIPTSSFPCPSATALGQRRAARNPALAQKLAQMALPLAPLVQLTTGQIHPAFPATLLSFWLLTDDELESLASFYHQRTPSNLSRFYPCPVSWSSDLPLEEKRRKLGKFIGLRGCETPTHHVVLARSAEDLMDEARRNAGAEDDGDEALRRKFGFYR
ncbi:hypothetical protein MGG_04411 [Pyricularia oryzae 70-15]|uniref:Beta-xylosidase n=2 Tax=Pyricularia oryzae TaxID=318829 RepID=G4MZE7_PYRO7|nr:uncharacterized protein MGG_04411 [Pyricularia oryzae 70-15]EHA53702.1 hypothetical protein MGG_04411 [Pyricularia oryzae 70-15]ELQ34851.1 hypothetical protein OOU_Y34scaffold00744g15 [Pyricularia oryzae Y34]KAI7930803.1 hypothetical protein M0657_001543 [Pyricularia oryzae]